MYSFFKQLVLPPMGPLLVILAGWLVHRRARRLGMALMWIGAVSLYGLATSYVSARMLASLETGIEALDPAHLPTEPGAIVVLAAGLEINAPQFGGATVDALALERLHYGARLHRLTGLPVLVTGGKPEEDFESLAYYMHEALTDDYGISPVWMEDASATTAENAENSAAILRRHGVESVFLVSQAFHLRRAAAVFANTGIHVVPAPARFTEPVPLEPFHLLPDPKGLQMGYWAVHEYLGILWYDIRGWL